LQHTQEVLEEKLSLKAEGDKCTTDDLFKVLVGVAAPRSTLAAVCADLGGTPDPQTICGYFNDQLRVEDLPALEQQLNAALAAEVPAHVRRQSRAVAIDYHDRPYYGKGEQAHELWVRGKATDGTTRFYRVATAYLILNGLRVTWAIHFVLPDDEAVRVVDRLLGHVHAQGIEVSCLFLDKGFESIALRAYLTRQGQAALIACPLRGTTGGTRALCQGRKSYATEHTFKDQHGQAFTAPVLVCRVFTTARRTGRLQRQAEWLLFIELGLTLSPRYARHVYGHRFGIETR
jgi:putative transposase